MAGDAAGNAVAARGSVHVAPMAAVSDRHWRMFIRCISPLPVLWSEMIWAHAIADESTADTERIIGFSPEERPIVLQLGGCDAAVLSRAAVVGAKRGYDAINLNAGCPAAACDRGTQRGIYGVRLMFEPELIRECCSAMREALDRAGFDAVDVTVKCRLGVDDRDSFEALRDLVTTVSRAGVRHFIVHARKADLALNANKNRSVPPLRPEWVTRLARELPHLQFTLNGGIGSAEEAYEWLHGDATVDGKLHGVMIGRRSNVEPFLYARWAALEGRADACRSRGEALVLYSAYAARAQRANWGGSHPETLVRSLLGPLLGLCHNTPHGPRWRRALTRLFGQRDALRSTPVDALIWQVVRECELPDTFLESQPTRAVPAAAPPLPDHPRGALVAREEQPSAAAAREAAAQDDERAFAALSISSTVGVAVA